MTNPSQLQREDMPESLVGVSISVIQGSMRRFVLDDNRSDYLIAREGSGNTVEIFDIVVNSERRKRKGHHLVNALIDSSPSAKSIYAITRASNLIAQAFYLHMRFRPVLLPDFYKDEPLKEGKSYTDAIMFVRDIRSQA